MNRIGLLSFLGLLSFGSHHATGGVAAPRLHEIAMVERGQYGIAFDPQRLTAHPGDTLRFVQRGGLPHDVRLRSRPAAATVPDTVASPLLTTRGETFEVILDERYVPGKYLFVCTPHEVLGMAFILYLEPAP